MRQRCVHPGPLVLGTALFKYPTPTTDRDRTVSRRSEPSSRTTLIGEQPNPFRLAFAFTLRGTVSVRAERTFERLRYLFGGDRPSQTARLTMSPDRIHGRRLEFQYLKSGIPRLAPRELASSFHSLPPILYIKYRNPISGYSKAPWGLSVLPRVTGIFTGTTISPGG